MYLAEDALPFRNCIQMTSSNWVSKLSRVWCSKYNGVTWSQERIRLQSN